LLSRRVDGQVVDERAHVIAEGVVVAFDAGVSGGPDAGSVNAGKDGAMTRSRRVSGAARVRAAGPGT